MSQRISELQEVLSLNGTELIEVSVPNITSPTGYVTRSASTSLFSGGSGIPHRFLFESSGFLDSDMTFTVIFSKTELSSIAFRPNSDSDPAGDWTLSNAIMNFNAIAALQFDGEPYEFSRFAPLNSSVWVNKSGAGLSNPDSVDGDQLRLGSYNNNNDNNLFNIPSSTPSNSYMTETPLISVVSVNDDFNNTATGEIIVRFRVGAPYSGWDNSPTGVILKGYVDINVLFSNFTQLT